MRGRLVGWSVPLGLEGIGCTSRGFAFFFWLLLPSNFEAGPVSNARSRQMLPYIHPYFNLLFSILNFCAF